MRHPLATSNVITLFLAMGFEKKLIRMSWPEADELALGDIPHLR